MKIEIWCWNKPRLGYKSCDIRDLPWVDYNCSAEKLPFKDWTIDEIYSRHVIEHFTLKEFLNVLNEWNRVLKNWWKLYIICPNMIWHMKQIINSDHNSLYNKEKWLNHRYWWMWSIFWWQQDQYDLHKFWYYFDLLKDILESFNFKDIKDYTWKDDSLENAEWHLEVWAIKKWSNINIEENIFNHLLDVKH